MALAAQATVSASASRDYAVESERSAGPDCMHGRWLETADAGSTEMATLTEHPDEASDSSPEGCDAAGGAIPTAADPVTSDEGDDRADRARGEGGATLPTSRTRGASVGADTTTTTSGRDAQAPTTASTTTTTSGEVRLWERNPPEVSQLRAGGEVPDGSDEIFDEPACGATSISVEAVVADQSAIRSVTLHWSFAGNSGQVSGSTPMQPAAGRYMGVLGSFPPGTAPNATSVSIRWWVEARDKNGNVGRADAPDGSGPLAVDERVTLVDCSA